MLFLTSLRPALSAATLFTALAASQTCYFPDKITVSSDVPCNATAAVSSCCASDAFCLDNGLCYNNGMVSRGSCTDQTWGSEACTGYCRTALPSSSVVITPCDATNDVFACGVNSTDCQTNTNTFQMSGGNALVLRPSQIAALVAPALQTSSSSLGASAANASTTCLATPPSGSATDMYSGGQLAGAICGIGIPLTLALVLALLLLRNERNKHATPKKMYAAPEEQNSSSYHFQTPPALRSQPSFDPSSPITAESVAGSRRGSLTNVRMPKAFMERYGSTTKRTAAQEMDLGIARHELDSAPPYEVPQRAELGDYRQSAHSE